MELRLCPSYPRWRVSHCGSVVEFQCDTRGWVPRRVWRPKPKPNNRGYCYVNGCCGETTKSIHQLVADAWVRPRTGTRQEYVLHRDDDPTNNAADNLYYGDATQNRHDAVSNGGCEPSQWSVDRLQLLQDRVLNGERVRDVAASVGSTGPTLSAAFNRYGFPRLPMGMRAASRVKAAPQKGV